jgi:hypothetical protein
MGGDGDETARTQDLDNLAHPHIHLRIHHAHAAQRHRRRGHHAGRALRGVGLTRAQAGAAEFGVLDQLGQHALDMQMLVDIGRFRDGEGEAHHELGL